MRMVVLYNYIYKLINIPHHQNGILHDGRMDTSLVHFYNTMMEHREYHLTGHDYSDLLDRAFYFPQTNHSPPKINSDAPPYIIANTPSAIYVAATPVSSPDIGIRDTNNITPRSTMASPWHLISILLFLLVQSPHQPLRVP